MKQRPKRTKFFPRTPPLPEPLELSVKCFDRKLDNQGVVTLRDVLLRIARLGNKETSEKDHIYVSYSEGKWHITIYHLESKHSSFGELILDGDNIVGASMAWINQDLYMPILVGKPLWSRSQGRTRANGKLYVLKHKIPQRPFHVWSLA